MCLAGGGWLPHEDVMDKGKLFLIAWDDAIAAERARVLRAAGWAVEVESNDSRRAHRLIRQLEPDVVVVDLSLRPTFGRDTARGLRGRDVTRHIPVIFVSGTEKDHEAVREVLPGSVFTTPADLVVLLDRLLGPPARNAE